MRLRLALVGLVLAAPLVTRAQHLMREIAVADSGPRRLGDLLEEVSESQGFYFSYNSTLVAEDSVVALDRFKGRLADLLERTFGSNYEFKEAPGYVIIRYAPHTLDLAMHIDSERSGTLVVTGWIKDAASHRGVPGASVYERNVLVSTLSDSDGRFKLSIRRPGESVWLTVSKADYRDTTVVLLPTVKVGGGDKGRRYAFYPDDGGKAGLESSALGRFFTSSKQRIQRINLGGFFAHSPYQVSLTPGLSSQGLFNSQVVNQVSLNLVGGYTAGVRGIEIGGGFNINQHDAHRVQVAGAFNLVGGQMRGLQVAGVSNVVLQRVGGVQIAGVANWGGEVQGVQLAGVFNKARRNSGLQLAGAMNTADGEAGVQVAGIVNRARHVRGVQVAGLVNIADSSDYPVGIVNLVKNGRKSITAGADESGMMQLAFRSGGRVLYGLVGVGHYLNGNPLKYVVEAGMGAHVAEGKTFLFDVELVSRTSTDLRIATGSRVALRVLPQFRIGRHASVIAGPALSYTYPEADHRYGGEGWQAGVYGGLAYRW